MEGGIKFPDKPFSVQWPGFAHFLVTEPTGMLRHDIRVKLKNELSCMCYELRVIASHRAQSPNIPQLPGRAETRRNRH